MCYHGLFLLAAPGLGRPANRKYAAANVQPVRLGLGKEGDAHDESNDGKSRVSQHESRGF
jgi:hypothetical protein